MKKGIIVSFELTLSKHLSRLMGKPTICIGKSKDTDQVTAKLISAFVFATRIVQFPFYLNPKFQASSSFLCFYRPICVGPVRKPHCWFSHEAAHFLHCFTAMGSFNKWRQIRIQNKQPMDPDWFPRQRSTDRFQGHGEAWP